MAPLYGLRRLQPAAVVVHELLPARADARPLRVPRLSPGASAASAHAPGLTDPVRLVEPLRRSGSGGRLPDPGGKGLWVRRTSGLPKGIKAIVCRNLVREPLPRREPGGRARTDCQYGRLLGFRRKLRGRSLGKEAVPGLPAFRKRTSASAGAAGQAGSSLMRVQAAAGETHPGTGPIPTPQEA